MSIVGGNKGCAVSKLACVNSDGGLPGGTTTNFIFDFGANLQLGCRVSIATVVFPNLIYNIRATNNNYTYQYDGNPSHTFTVTPGQYNIGTLLAALNADLTTTTAGAGLWSYDTVTNTVAFTVIGAHTITLNYTGANPNPSIELMTLLGGGSLSVLNSSASSTGPVSLSGSYAPQLGGPQMVYLRSTAIAPTNSIEANGRYSNTLIGIPVTAPYLSLNVFECKQDILCELQYARPRDLSTIDFQLTDDIGNVYDLRGGIVDIQLKIWFNN